MPSPISDENVKINIAESDDTLYRQAAFFHTN